MSKQRKGKAFHDTHTVLLEVWKLFNIRVTLVKHILMYSQLIFAVLSSVAFAISYMQDAGATRQLHAFVAYRLKLQPQAMTFMMLGGAGGPLYATDKDMPFLISDP